MKVTQKNQIKNHLLMGKPISAQEALIKYGCFRLAARIKDLRDEGLLIHTDKRRGYAVYSLDD